MFITLLLVACGSSSWPDPTALDLTEELEPGQARAGVVTDPAALFGGVSAEGLPGDIKIYNSEVRFIIQGLRAGAYYIEAGGNLIDADIVRPSDQAGRDLIDEASPMIGVGRLVSGEEIQLLADGRFGTAAVVRVIGKTEPMALISGALENANFIPALDATVTTDYILAPDSHLLEMVTTVAWEDEGTTLSLGDLAMLSADVSETWRPGTGFETEGFSEPDWLGVVGMENEVAMALMASAPGGFPPNVFADLLASIGPVMTGLGDPITVAEGETLSWRRYVGVGPDLATLTDAWHERLGTETTLVTGTVTANGAPVAGARVHLLENGTDPWTLAISKEDGSWSAQLPADTSFSAIATGRGRGISCDLEEGAGWYPPYADPAIRERSLEFIRLGASPIPNATGYGISELVDLSTSTTLSLTPPATLSVDTGDGRPAVVRIDFASGDPVESNSTFYSSRPGGAGGWIYLRDGSGELNVEPGSYIVTTHRGVLWETDQQSVELTSGERTEISAALTQAYRPSGVTLLDPHSHAAPSSDGEISMAERLVVQAAHGIDIHLGTDHDHVADYRPLVTALGLDQSLRSVVADEVSPVLRGHFNAFPVEPDPTLPNHGAPAWWNEIRDTPSLFTEIRSAFGTDVLVQANHPVGSKGMLSYAGYELETGTIASSEHWSDDFDLIEVLNDGDYDDYLPYYLDLISRGMEPTPVGVSDSHGHRGGVGNNLTFLYTGLDKGLEITDEQMVEAFRNHATVVGHGAFIEATIDGAWAPGQTFVGAQELTLKIWAPSWIAADTVEILENGTVIESIEIPKSIDPERYETSISLAPTSDAHYVVIATGHTSMEPAYPGKTPWSMTAAIRLDMAGDGWDPPMPALSSR